MALLSKLLEGLGRAGNVLDLPGSSARDLIAFENPFDQWLTPTSSANRTSGRQLLERAGLVGENTPGLDLGDVGGFLVEMPLDPINAIIPLGAAAKTARAASKARRANQGIEQANKMSLAMREAGALPEEMLPQATKLYNDAVFTDQRLPIPGVAPEGVQYRSQITREPLSPDIWNENMFLEGRPFEVRPDLANITVDELDDIIARGRDFQDRMMDMDDPGLGTWAYHMANPWRGAPELSSATGTAARQISASILDPSFPMDPTILDDIAAELPHLIERTRTLQSQVPIRGSVRNQPSPENLIHREAIRKGSQDPMARNDPLLILSDLLDEAGDPAAELLRMSEETIGDASRLLDESDRMIQPAASSTQSFFTLNDSLTEGLGRGIPERTGLMPGADLYLPYVAPELQELLPVPQMNKGRLSAMLGAHNALARNPYRQNF